MKLQFIKKDAVYIAAKKIDIKPAKGIVSILGFFLLRIINSNKENSKEKTKSTKNEIMEKQKDRKTKNKRSPIPIPLLIKSCFKINLV
jgi:hypothetical protein